MDNELQFPALRRLRIVHGLAMLLLFSFPLRFQLEILRAGAAAVVQILCLFCIALLSKLASATWIAIIYICCHIVIARFARQIVTLAVVLIVPHNFLDREQHKMYIQCFLAKGPSRLLSPAYQRLRDAIREGKRRECESIETFSSVAHASASVSSTT